MKWAMVEWGDALGRLAVQRNPDLGEVRVSGSIHQRQGVLSVPFVVRHTTIPAYRVRMHIDPKHFDATPEDALTDNMMAEFSAQRCARCGRAA